jgi:hypothetical protein
VAQPESSLMKSFLLSVAKKSGVCMFEIITGPPRDLKMAKTMKECELCELSARLYCESDEASLCWDCDAKVHSANFLVARHCRSLLCQICQSVTAWRASGAKPGLTVSVCERCAGGSRAKSDGDDDEGNNDENQVVPLASGYSGPPLSSSSADQEESSGDERHCAESPLSIAPPDAASHKRPHESLALYTNEGDCGCSSSGVNNSNNNLSGCEDDATSSRIRVLKIRKADQGLKDDLVKTLEVIRREDHDNSTVLAICKLCRDSHTRELVSVDCPSNSSRYAG